MLGSVVFCHSGILNFKESIVLVQFSGIMFELGFSHISITRLIISLRTLFLDLILICCLGFGCCTRYLKLNWIGTLFRFSLVLGSHSINYRVSLSINYLWNLGFGLSFGIVVQMLSGFILISRYSNDCIHSSLLRLMSECWNGALIRTVHSVMCSLIWALIYSHMMRGLYYLSSSHLRMIWLSGILLYLIYIVCSFLGYVLPYGQMSYWGATVIINLFTWVPMNFILWVLGGYGVSGVCVVRFCLYHVLISLIGGLLIMIHMFMLHRDSSSCVLGVSTHLDLGLSEVQSLTAVYFPCPGLNISPFPFSLGIHLSLSSSFNLSSGSLVLDGLFGFGCWFLNGVSLMDSDSVCVGLVSFDSDVVRAGLIGLMEVEFVTYIVMKDCLLGYSLLLTLLTLGCNLGFMTLCDCENAVAANSLITPSHIVPEWYFLGLYCILKCVFDGLSGLCFCVILIFIGCFVQGLCSRTSSLYFIFRVMILGFVGSLRFSRFQRIRFGACVYWALLDRITAHNGGCDILMLCVICLGILLGLVLGALGACVLSDLLIVFGRLVLMTLLSGLIVSSLSVNCDETPNSSERESELMSTWWKFFDDYLAWALSHPHICDCVRPFWYETYLNWTVQERRSWMMRVGYSFDQGLRLVRWIDAEMSSKPLRNSRRIGEPESN